MNITDVRIGTRMELELVNRMGDATSQLYVTQLIDILNENEIIIPCPIFESKFVFIATETRVRLMFLHDQFGLLAFHATIFFKEKRGNFFLLHARITSDFEKIQRREYFRLPCFLNTLYYLRPEKDQDKNEFTEVPTKDFKKSMTKNISGNGACMIVNENIPKNSTIEVYFTLTETLSIRAIAKVVRSELMDLPQEKKYDLGVYFKSISPKDQDITVKYIFDQQRSLLKKNI